MTSLYVEQLLQIFGGLTSDADLLNEWQRDELIRDGFAVGVSGWNVITPAGVTHLVGLDICRRILPPASGLTPAVPDPARNRRGS